MAKDFVELANDFEQIVREISDTRQRAIHIEDKINSLLEREVRLAVDPDHGQTDQRWGGRTFAQHGDDLISLAILDQMGITKPTYIDVGAHSPYHISNTALMHSMGCRGVNIEANPNLFTAFETQRPDDINLNVGISDKPGVMTFYMFDATSGLNTFDPSRVKLMEDGGFKVEKTMDIPMITLNEVIEKHCNGVFPDFFTMDVEGLDAPILATIDFTKHRPSVICVEANNAEEEETIKGIVLKAGYVLAFKSCANLFFADASKYKI